MVAIPRRISLPIAMTYDLAREIVGSDLGKAGKMPGPSWGISALECKRGSRLAAMPGTVCARCYARRGRYTCGSVKRAHERRLTALEHPRWVEAMSFLIRFKAAGGHMRWFDSGDLQSLRHLELIVEVCKRSPRTKHWIPTHEIVIVAKYLAKHGAFPRNLVVRPSSDDIDKWVPQSFGLPTSTVHSEKGQPVQAPDGDRRRSIECKAYTRGNVCGPCRACWDARVENTSFPQH